MPRKLSTTVPGVAAVVLGVALLTGGCTDIRTAEPGDESPTSAEPPTQHLKLELGADKYGPVSADVPRKPIGAAPANVGDLRFEVFQLKRTKKAVTVIFALHNTGNNTIDLKAAVDSLDVGFHPLFMNAADVSLLDSGALKEYLVFFANPDEYTGCLCSTTWTGKQQDFKPDERRYYATVVAAPPPDVKKVTVLSGAATVPDVAITD